MSEKQGALMLGSALGFIVGAGFVSNQWIKLVLAIIGLGLGAAFLYLGASRPQK